MSGDPIARRRGEGNALRRFRTAGIILSNGLQLKDRPPVEMGKMNGQHDQFVTEVKRAVVFRPIVIIIELPRQLLSALPGVAVPVP